MRLTGISNLIPIPMPLHAIAFVFGFILDRQAQTMEWTNIVRPI